MNKLGILVNCRTVTKDTNFTLMKQLYQLTEVSDKIHVQINITGDTNTLPELVELGNEKFTISLQRLTGRVTNAKLRGRYREMNCEYVLFIDDDFIIDNISKTVHLLDYIVQYMDEHPTCSITRFRFNRDEPYTGNTVHITYPITSTSLACGILIRTKNGVFTEEQLDWHWKSDDYTMILNALRNGYGIEVDKHWFRHLMQGKPEDIRFDPVEILNTIPNRRERLIKQLPDGIPYTGTDAENDSTGYYIRTLLIDELKDRTLIHNGSWSPTVAVNCDSSLLRAGLLKLSDKGYDIRIFSGRSKEYLYKLADCVKDDCLIVAAGALPDHYVQEVKDSIQADITKYNCDCISKYIRTANHGKCSIIYLGSVAKDRSFPAQPQYAGDKSFMYNYLRSLEQANPNLRVHYLTIPSTKSNMCDHGFNPDNIFEHIHCLLTTGYVSGKILHTKTFK